MTRKTKQLTLDVFPNPRTFYRENIIKLIIDNVREFKKEVEKHGLPITTALKKSGSFLKSYLYDIYSKTSDPKNRTAETINLYYDALAAYLYKDFVERAGRTDIKSFEEYLRKYVPTEMDSVMLQNIRSLKKGLPIPERHRFEKIIKNVHSWKLDVFLDPQLRSMKKYVKHLSNEIKWREQAIQRVEKEIEELKKNRQLMKIVKEKNWLNKELETLKNTKPQNPKERRALELAILIKDRYKLLQTMKNVSSQQKKKLQEYKRILTSMKVDKVEKRVKKEVPFVKIQEQLYKSRKKIAPLLTLHKFSRRKR